MLPCPPAGTHPGDVDPDKSEPGEDGKYDKKYLTRRGYVGKTQFDQVVESEMEETELESKEHEKPPQQNVGILLFHFLSH